MCRRASCVDKHSGGTSGCVIAGRLAEDIDAKVLVLEAGPDNADLENVHMAGGQVFPTLNAASYTNFLRKVEQELRQRNRLEHRYGTYGQRRRT